MGLTGDTTGLSRSSWLDRTTIEQIDLFHDYSKYSESLGVDAKKYRVSGSDYQGGSIRQSSSGSTHSAERSRFERDMMKRSFSYSR